MRPHYQSVIDDLNLLEILGEFKPRVIGTPPLGIDLPTSDIDIACQAEDLEHFSESLRKQFGDLQQFSIKQVNVSGNPAVSVSFFAHDWEIEIYCETRPVERQWGYRHFFIEHRLLELAPGLRSTILELRELGLKTEPAFARALTLRGDPYEAMLELESKSDAELIEMAFRAKSA